MPEPNTGRVSLLVLYSPQLEECRRFYSSLGLVFSAEHHGDGPDHYAAVLGDGTVFELYPAPLGRTTGALRLGLEVDGVAAALSLAPGRHVVKDPDGRTVELQVSDHSQA